MKWSEGRQPKAAHPMSTQAEAARLLKELPYENPAKAVLEASAWLESAESEPMFSAAHRLMLVSMIDDATHASAEELTLAYVGARTGLPAQPGDWRALMDYLDRLAAGYAAALQAYEANPGDDIAPRIATAVVRMMRTVTRSMKVSWMRYLPPDRASWELLVHGYRAALGHGFAKKAIPAYARESQYTSPLHELSLGVMMAAAAPQSLTPRQVQIVYAVAHAYRAAFGVSEAYDESWRHYLFDLHRPGPPARIPEQLSNQGGLLFFSGEHVLPKLQALLSGSSEEGSAMNPFTGEFGITEVRGALEHVARYWDDNPPARRDERKRLNTKIQVEIGIAALQRALEVALEESRDLSMLGEASGEPAEQGGGVVAMNAWTLTDFSARGIGARVVRRLDRWLRVGSILGFKLERSDKWCVGIVRRLRTDARNQTDVGVEILAKAAILVTLEGSGLAGGVAQLAGSAMRSTALMLPEDVQLNARASLLFEPGTNAPGQIFVLHDGDTSRRIKLGHVSEWLDGWQRVEFDWVE
ncbi:MAG TPA: hypothetical protein VED01_16850 [Burkholderiales bacterium]|nr:hypothetical protein [Burkholderiales bacterium]